MIQLGQGEGLALSLKKTRAQQWEIWVETINFHYMLINYLQNQYRMLKKQVYVTISVGQQFTNLMLDEEEQDSIPNEFEKIFFLYLAI